MTEITPWQFWEAYKKELLRKAALDSSKAALAYRSNSLWTSFAVDAAETAVKELGLLPQREYFRIDLIGFERCDGKRHNWTLRIAFEHENTKNWKDELCKLCHVAADLRILVAYWDFSKIGTPLQRELEECCLDLKLQLQRYNGSWLLVFGPLSRSFSEEHPFVAYSLKGNDLQLLPDDGALNPLHWTLQKQHPSSPPPERDADQLGENF